MAVVKELIRKEENGTLSFGNYELPSKQKVSDFSYQGDNYKVKTFREITKLERNGMFVYESVPGTVVKEMKLSETEVAFTVEGLEDTQITMELEPEKEYRVKIGEEEERTLKTNLGGKLVLSVELDAGQEVDVKVTR